MSTEKILKFAEKMDAYRSIYYPAELIHKFQAADECAGDVFREYAGALAYYKEHDADGSSGPYLLEAIECAAEMEDLYAPALLERWPYAAFELVHYAACLLYMAETGETD